MPNKSKSSTGSAYIPQTDSSYYKSFGGWPRFMHSYGLKPWDDNDVEEGKRIIETFKEQDRLQWEEEQAQAGNK